MKRFAIKLNKNDDVTILGVRETKEQAIALGLELRKQYSCDAGLLAVIEAQFDSENNMLGNAYQLHEVIR